MYINTQTHLFVGSLATALGVILCLSMICLSNALNLMSGDHSCKSTLFLRRSLSKNSTLRWRYTQNRISTPHDSNPPIRRVRGFLDSLKGLLDSLKIKIESVGFSLESEAEEALQRQVTGEGE